MSTNPCMEMKVGLLKGTVDEAVVEVSVGGGGEVCLHHTSRYCSPISWLCFNPQHFTGPQARMELDTLCADLAEVAQEVHMQ